MKFGDGPLFSAGFLAFPARLRDQDVRLAINRHAAGLKIFSKKPSMRQRADHPMIHCPL
jgi:hypothetical protein